MAIGTFPTHEFDTYADTQVSGALGSKKKYVVVKANELQDDAWTFHFFDGDVLHDIASPEGVTVDLSNYQTLTTAEALIQADTTADVSHKGKLIELDGSLAAVTFTIDPALFTGYTLKIRCSDATNIVTVAAASGTLELESGDTPTSIELQAKQNLKLFSDGTKLIQVL
jgi:hypothetical protein